MARRVSVVPRPGPRPGATKSQSPRASSARCSWSASWPSRTSSLQCRATARRSQAGLRADLDAAGVAYESRYIVNALVVEADLKSVESIAARYEQLYLELLH